MATDTRPDPAPPTGDGVPLSAAEFSAAALSAADIEDRLCELAGRLAATEAEFLRLVAELDARELWGLWGLRSAAHWLSWRLGMRLGAARERVRVARALSRLPEVAAAFAHGRLSYCKVRALTRVATPVNESELLEVALGTTGAQLERVLRAWRRVLVTEMSAASQVGRSLRRRADDDGSIVYTLRVPADDAAVVDAALGMARTVVLDDQDEPVETPEEARLAADVTDDPPRARADADAFVLLAESFVASGPVGDRGDGLEVVLHADLDALLRAGTGDPEVGGAAPVRSREGQPLISATALRRLCEASVRVLVHDPTGRPLDLGRSVRHASRKQRRALHERDRGCCRFPGCTQRRRLVPHHIDWWSAGGPTDLDNLVLLCPSHHRAVHEVGYQVIARRGGRLAFRTPTGLPVPEVPGQPWAAPLARAEDGYRTPLPTWGGEHLDLRLLVDSMVANTINASGRLLPTVPYADLPAVLREATGWPMASRPLRADRPDAA